MIGQTLNKRYRITALLGEGAMGEVYRATDMRTRQEVAVKVITQKLVSNAALLERFRREGTALGQLHHASIVAFVEAFPIGKQYAIVMEYVAGGSLRSLLTRGPLRMDQAVRIALDLSDALAHAHRINIVHRDVKPDNVLMAADGTPKLTDFGVARLVDRTTQLTGLGSQVGTPYYMSPEAWEGKPLDAQADIWSLGVVLYELLSGQVPFGGDTMAAVMTQVLTAPLPDIKALRPGTPPALVNVVQRMLTRDKAERYRTMRQVAVDLEEIEADLKRAQAEARRKAEEEREARALAAQEAARRAQEARLRAEEEQKARAWEVQAEARRKAEEEEKIGTLVVQEEAPLNAQEELKATAQEPRQAEEAIDTAIIAPKTKAEESGGGAKRAVPGRALVLGGTAVLAVACLLIAGSVGLWAGQRLLVTATATQSATPVPPTAMATITADAPTDTFTPTPTYTLTPSPSPSPTFTFTSTSTPSATLTATSTASSTPRAKPTATYVRMPTFTPRPYTPTASSASCTIAAIFGANAHPGSADLYVWEGDTPWGNSRVTCGNQVFTTSRPGLSPLPLPTGCSLFGNGLGVGSAGDWWADPGTSGQVSLGINCNGNVRTTTFSIIILQRQGGGGGGPATISPP